MTTSSLALLLHPSANRVYAEASVALTAAELTILGERVLDGRLTAPTPEVIAGVPYLVFEVADLTDRDLRHLANVSTAYAIFEREGDLLRPLTLTRLDQHDDDLLSTLKYSGKTNETFTKLLLNVTVLASAAADRMLDQRLRVLDPLCGRGTTLNQALMYGWDAAGIDVDSKDFDAYAAFLRYWLEHKRLKHTLAKHPVRHEGKRRATRLEATFARDKSALRSGAAQRVEVVHADTLRAGEFFRPRSFDVVVADAPYGVQHGSRSTSGGLARGPVDLVAEALPVWIPLLRRGGAIGIAWNTKVASRDRLAELLRDADLEVVEASGYLDLEHRVDQAIVRDVVVARRPT